MSTDRRYIISLTDSTHKVLAIARAVYRRSDDEAMDAAERELRRHRNSLGLYACYDGWRLTVKLPPHWTTHIVAEVRPGYDSRAPQIVSGSDPDGFPF